MKFAQTFIKHHVMTILLYILVVVFGFYSFQNLPLALMPSMEVPAAVVYATYPGAGPEDIEQQVTKKLEGAVAGLSGLIRSSPPRPRIWLCWSSGLRMIPIWIRQ